MQVFGCSPRAWWDVAAFQALRSSQSSAPQLNPRSKQGPEGKTMLGFDLGVFLEEVEDQSLLKSSTLVRQTLTYVQHYGTELSVTVA